MKQPHYSGMTPLHLSATWSEGVALLLKGGAEVNAYDSHRHTPLRYAVWSENTSTTSLLLEHDSPVGGSCDQNMVLDLLYRLDNVTLKENFIRHLVNRRKRLWDLAHEQLPRLEFERLGLQDDRILDAKASLVSSALLEHGIEIDPALMPSLNPRRTTVYHTDSLEVLTASMLFEAGFHDIDELDHYDQTPFCYHTSWLLWHHSMRRLELLKWLKGKGADGHREHARTGGMAMHGVGARIGGDFYDEGKGWKLEPLTKQEVSTAAFFLQDDVTDNCLCACSKNGCRIITSALKNCRDWWKSVEFPDRKSTRKDISLPVCISLLQSFEEETGKTPWMPFEVIRVMTFEWSELTHTCHVDAKNHWDKPRGLLPQHEIHEIREEERYLLEQHEELVSRFETKFTELGLPLTTFLEEHWAPAMIDVLEGNQKRNVDEEQKMRELGVVVDERDGFREVKSNEEELGQEDSIMEDMDSDSEPFHDCEDPVGES